MNHPASTQSQVEELPRSGSETFLTRLPALGSQATDKARARATTAFLIGLALICAATTLIGAVPTHMFGHDTFIPLEMGWRVLHGQRPDVDFVSGWGPVWFLLAAAGLAISRHSVDGIGYANAIMAVIVAVWSFALGRDRLLPLWRVIFSLFLAALVVAPYPLGISPLQSSHAMVYNRYGFALLGLILLECLEPSLNLPKQNRLGARLGGFWEGLSTGAALSLTLFLKASYFLVGAGIVVALALILTRVEVPRGLKTARDDNKELGRWPEGHLYLNLRRILGMLVGFAAVSLALLAYLRFDLLAMLRDLRMTGAARNAVFTSEGIVNKLTSRPSMLLTVVLFAWVSALVLGNRIPRWRGWRLPLAGVLLFGADLALMITNQQWEGFPLSAAFAILLSSDILRDQQAQLAAQASSYRPLYAGALCLGVLLFVPQFAGDLFGLAYGVWSKETAPGATEVVRFISPNLAPLILYDGHIPRSNGRVLVTYVNDGVDLLQRSSRPDETILAIDMTNVFPYALERPPAHGGIASPTYHFNIDDDHRPSDDEFFGDAAIVMVPKHPALDDHFYQDFLRAYEPGLHQRYTLAAESSWWWMYRKK